MQTWQLPEYIADILPQRARHLEQVKANVLALFGRHGYELVYPPLLEYSDALLTHIDSGLSLKTLRLSDPISGRQLGIRADITPQVARIDAHLLSANQGINRLCYAAPVLHAQPDGFLTTREPLQTGAELYGCTDIAADIELIDLMLKTLEMVCGGKMMLSLGHIGIFRALARAAALNEAQSQTLLALLQNKDRAEVAAHTRDWQLDAIWAQAFDSLTELYGTRNITQTARQRLPQLAAVTQALDELERICQAFPDQAVHIDLAEVRADRYHSGLLYAAYTPAHHDAVARGGRYDGLGAYFGRARPATGFSFDLRRFAGEHAQTPATVAVAQQDAAAARAAVERLRSEGVRVVIDYGLPDNSGTRQGRLLEENGEWVVKNI
ncbi:ATP phosphoribosyltransferase regulatory subunit [Conchiformibius steedae DSM 2580]|uniref:ATP phosphoribosyltransferase regulatory subunit n=1 Tax=Conchiformibius steedae DSM 2580 TaxID=1121352 RepID=A0AAE9L051_9NEIS|nr:ATP phosphoribosyltransferase regulatory subunit [Conchiformibius steedae]QMT33410.1 ATP phosphoribosyltransferase regulatory subunit [Conchiformibius steedae]URD68061.1 ATP phosphoribosyltransferase regulatory subunit [Conchiformibius steedae DSM 2580]